MKIKQYRIVLVNLFFVSLVMLLSAIVLKPISSLPFIHFFTLLLTTIFSGVILALFESQRGALSIIRILSELFVLRWEHISEKGSLKLLHNIIKDVTVRKFKLNVNALDEKLAKCLMMGKVKFIVSLSPLILVSISILIRFVLAGHIPFTNDEGYYFYDGALILDGLIPYRDFLTKSIPHIYLITLFTQIFGNDIFYVRLLPVAIYICNSILLYAIAKHLFSRQVAVATMLIYSLFAEFVILTTYVQTQQTQTFFVLLLLYLGLKSSGGLLRSLLLGLLSLTAFLSRPTSILHIGLLMVILIANEYFRSKSYSRSITEVIRFVGILTIVSMLAYFCLEAFIGQTKALDVFGREMAKQSASSAIELGFIDLTTQVGSQLFTIVKGIFRSPLIGVLIYICFLSVPELYSVKKTLRYFGLGYILSWIAVYSGDLHSKVFIVSRSTEHILSLFIISTYPIQSLKKPAWTGIESYVSRNFSYILLSLWMLGYLLLYAVWIKYRIHYFSEIIPLLSLVTGLGVVAVMKKSFHESRFWGIVTAFTLMFFLIVGNLRHIYTFPSGSHLPKTIYMVTKVIEDNTVPTDEVLTSSPIFLFQSGRDTPFKISHPIWYSYTDIDGSLLTEYLPPYQRLIEYIITNPPKLIIEDKTGENVYLKSPIVSKLIAEKYELLYETLDRGRPIRVYIRVD